MEEVFLSMSPIIKQNLSLGVQIDSKSVLFFPILLHRVNNEKEWLDFIKKYQPIVENTQIFICDLHFNLNDIRIGKTKCTVRKGAVPILGYVFSNFDSMLLLYSPFLRLPTDTNLLLIE